MLVAPPNYTKEFLDDFLIRLRITKIGKALKNTREPKCKILDCLAAADLDGFLLGAECLRRHCPPAFITETKGLDCLPRLRRRLLDSERGDHV